MCGVSLELAVVWRITDGEGCMQDVSFREVCHVSAKRQGGYIFKYTFLKKGSLCEKGG